MPVVENVGTKVNGAVSFSIAGEGALIYVRGEVASEAQRTLVWVDREGREEPLSLPPRAYTRVAVSPDGARAAVVIEEPDNNDVWTSELARGTLIKVTTDPANDDAPLWTPDGQQLVFSSNRDGLVGLFRKAADGRGDVEQLVTLEGVLTVSAYDWSPDGTELLLNARTPEHSFDVNVLSMEGERSWTPLLPAVVSEGSPALSPDGSWVAYNSNETGQEEVYVERFPDLGDRRLVSTDGGEDPLWSPDGKELFYRSLGGGMMVVAVDTEPTFTLETPEVVFEGENYFQRGGRRHDISPDGQRFLLIKQDSATDGSSDPAEIAVVLNWHQELLEPVPVN